MRRESIIAGGAIGGPGGASQSRLVTGEVVEDRLDGSEGRRPRSSRRRFLGRTAAGTAAAGLLVTAPGTASAAVPQLYLGENRRLFQEILNDENSHANFLAGTLGTNARPHPIFKNLVATSANQFAAMAYSFENIGSRAYAAAIPYINSVSYLSAATRIAQVEGRHSGFLNALLNTTLVPGGIAFETPMFQLEVVNVTAPYVSSLNGGSVPGYDELRSDQNDINILNFALFLEYLESQFYSINVPRFYS